MENPQLQSLYKQAAQKAFDDGISADQEKALTNWIWYNCKFPLECLFYLVLGIGCELADLQAQQYGYKHESERAFVAAKIALYFPLI